MGSSEVSLQKFVHLLCFPFLREGNMVGRRVATNLISLAGPDAGIASIPWIRGSGIWSILEESLLKIAIYNNFIQVLLALLAPAGYTKIPTVSNQVMWFFYIYI
uniref:Uncharacterized protein n=1 Tax=Solanum lycopersicum TaxID=4081 RepID=A0A3Q7G361_SOLLC